MNYRKGTAMDEDAYEVAYHGLVVAVHGLRYYIEEIEQAYTYRSRRKRRRVIKDAKRNLDRLWWTNGVFPAFGELGQGVTCMCGSCSGAGGVYHGKTSRLPPVNVRDYPAGTQIEMEGNSK